MVTKKTKPLAFIFVSIVSVLQNIFPIFGEKKKEGEGEKHSSYTNGKITDKLPSNVLLGSFA